MFMNTQLHRLYKHTYIQINMYTLQTYCTLICLYVRDKILRNIVAVQQKLPRTSFSSRLAQSVKLQ